MNTIKIKFKKTDENAQLPCAKRKGDIGYDVCCISDLALLPGRTYAIDTGLQLADVSSEDSQGSNFFIKIESRSGLALKGVFAVGGIIDSNYRGNIMVILYNGNPSSMAEEFEMKAGDRIAQLVIYKAIGFSDNNEVQFEETTDVTETDRGAQGFGSSGA